MGFIQGFKETILRCDLLACSPSLRVRGQSSYESVEGGLLSLALMITFIVIFSTSFLSVLNKVDISSSLSSSDQIQSTTQISDLQFAIGIQDVPLGGSSRYFDIYMEQVSIINGVASRSQVLLQPCDINDWKDMGDNFEQQFNVFGMNQMLCVQNGTQVTMKGYEGSPNFQYLSLKVKTCTNNSYQTHACQSNAAITAFMNTYLSSNDFFKVKFLIVDTRISPSQSNPVNKLLQKKIFLSFTDTLGTTGFINFAHYEITTDTSIMPYSDVQTLQGNYIHKYQTSTIGISGNHFIHMQFYKTTEQLTVSRQVVKIDAMLSYVGGLFGLLFVAIEFFLASFNQYRYQLYAAQSAFTFDQSGKKIKEKDFGLLTYFGYSLYDWLNVFGLAPKCWGKMRQIDEVRQQINAQMDVTYLFRKIRSLQKISACLLNQNKRICSLLTRQFTLQQTQKQRKLMELYANILPDYSNSGVNNNRVSPIDEEKSGNDLIFRADKLSNNQQTSMENNSNIDFLIQDEDQDFEELMNTIKDAYSSLEIEKDELSKKIRQKIPNYIKKAIAKSKRTRKIMIQNLEPKNFESCENSFVNSKYK